MEQIDVLYGDGWPEKYDYDDPELEKIDDRFGDGWPDEQKRKQMQCTCRRTNVGEVTLGRSHGHLVIRPSISERKVGTPPQ